MKILFIITSDADSDRYIIQNTTGNGIYIPLGIAQLAAILEHENHKVSVLDLRLERQKNAVTARIKQFAPDFVAFSLSFLSAKSAFTVAKHIKKRYGLPIIVGGPYASVFQDTILKEHPAIDLVVLGEGEIAISEIARAKNLKNVKGIIYRDGKHIKKTVQRPLISDLDSLPCPAIHLFDFKRYIPLAKHYRRLPLLPVNTTRGCFWGKCSFCFQRVPYRRQSVKYVVDLLEHYVNKFGVREIRFWDDTFIDGSDWIIDFCSALNKRRLGIIWGCHARVNLVTPNILNHIAKSGCWQIMYGIESGNQILLDKINKGIKLKDATNAVQWAKDAGLSVRVSFMLGIPGETPDMADQTIRYAKMLDADITQFGFTTPYPGTRMHAQLKGSSRLDKNIDNYCEYKPVFVPKGYRNKKQLEKKLRKAYRTIYINPKFFYRNLRQIDSLQDIKRYYSGFKVLMGMISNRK